MPQMDKILKYTLMEPSQEFSTCNTLVLCKKTSQMRLYNRES